MIGVIVFMSFFLCGSQFLSNCRFRILQQLTSTWYFDVVWQGSSVALRNISLTLTCFNLGVNPKASGAWRRIPGGGGEGCGGVKIPAQEKKILVSPAKKNIYHVVMYQKLRIAQKKVTYAKNQIQFQSTLQIWPLLKKVEFLSAQNAPFERPQRPNAI